MLESQAGVGTTVTFSVQVREDIRMYTQQEFRCTTDNLFNGLPKLQITAPDGPQNDQACSVFHAASFKKDLECLHKASVGPERGGGTSPDITCTVLAPPLGTISSKLLPRGPC